MSIATDWRAESLVDCCIEGDIHRHCTIMGSVSFEHSFKLNYPWEELMLGYLVIAQYNCLYLLT